MQTLLSQVSLACCTTLLALSPLTNAAIASPPPLTKVPQTTSTPKTSVTPKTTPVQSPVKTEAIAPATTPTVTTPVTPQVAAPAATTTPPTNTVSTSDPKAAVTKPETKPETKPTTTAATSENKVLASRLVLDLSDRKVYVYKDDSVIATYPVAVGKKGWDTPTGKFQVIQMSENPIWENPWNGKKVPASINGPIGVRWIGFWTDGKNTIGFHGTPVKHEKFLGQAVSHGCVRMKNPDVVSLFAIVKPGTPVIVQK